MTWYKRSQIILNPIEFYRVLHLISIKLDIYHVFISLHGHSFDSQEKETDINEIKLEI